MKYVSETNMKKALNLLKKNIHLVVLIFIIYLGVYVRSSTSNTKIMLDYDPWWYYRHTKFLVDNNFQVPKWDLLSFFPPGRPVFDPMGWEYMVAISYKIVSMFISIDFMRFAIWSPAIISGLIAIPAYLTGKIITNKWGGLVTALFSVLAPSLIGVSMAGYMDTDALVVFMTFLSTFAILHALQKRTIFSYVLAIFVMWVYTFSWSQSWYVLEIFISFLFIYFVGSIVISSSKLIGKGLNFIQVLKETTKKFKPYFVCLLIIAIASNVLAIITNRPDIISSTLFGFNWLLGGEMIVNVSIAELQPINIFTQSGFLMVAGRTGISLYFALFLPLIILFKFWKKMKISFGEVFAFLWLGITFYLILHGVRFSLLFSAATSAAAGFVVGNLLTIFKTMSFDSSELFKSAIAGFIAIFILMELSNGLQLGNSMGGMEVDDNWVGMLDWLKNNATKDAIVSTWWDPGHILAGYTGLRVHADGAHCGSSDCIPYDHNIRIQNMGRIMSTSDEKEAVDILKKYMQLTPEQCQEDHFEAVARLQSKQSSALLGRLRP